MIIGVHGKKQSGKDTVCKIIQYLTTDIKHSYCFQDYYNWEVSNLSDKDRESGSKWKTIRFSNKLKDMVCILTGCTREELEDESFKNSPLGYEWIRDMYLNNDNELIEKHKVATGLFHAVRQPLTYRKLLQLLGTDCGRKIIHPNIWVNSTMRNYKGEDVFQGDVFTDRGIYPDWVIPDVRFPNEIDAIITKGGFTVKVIRPLKIGDKFKWSCFGDIRSDVVVEVTGSLKANSNYCYYTESSNGKNYVKDLDVQRDTHESETALDNHVFAHTIYNDGNINDLIINVSNLLQNKGLL